MRNRALTRAAAATLTDSFLRSDEARAEALPLKESRQTSLQSPTTDEMYRIAARLVTAMKPGEKVIACTGVTADDPSAKFTLDLGIALARLGHSSVMVIDGNFRNPAIHAALGTQSAPGLSDLLLDSGAEVATIRLAEVPNLQILTAGDVSGAAPATLTSAAFGSRLDSFRACEFVVMDIGPLLVSPESVLLASASDVVVAALANGERSRKDLLRLKYEVTRVNSRFLGVVLAEAE